MSERSVWCKEGRRKRQEGRERRREGRREGGREGGLTHRQDNVRVACPGDVHVQTDQVFSRLHEADARHGRGDGAQPTLGEGGREGGRGVNRASCL